MAAFQFPSNPTVGQLYTPSPSRPTYVCRVSNPPSGSVWEKIGMGYSHSPVAFTATAGQTSFAVNYQVGAVEVFIEGGRLEEAEFTATNGTSIVMPYGMLGGERVIVIPSAIVSTIAQTWRQLGVVTLPSINNVMAFMGVPADIKRVRYHFDIKPNPGAANFVTFLRLSSDGVAYKDGATDYATWADTQGANAAALMATTQGAQAQIATATSVAFPDIGLVGQGFFRAGSATQRPFGKTDAICYTGADFFRTSYQFATAAPYKAVGMLLFASVVNAFDVGSTMTVEGSTT